MSYFCQGLFVIYEGWHTFAPMESEFFLNQPLLLNIEQQYNHIFDLSPLIGMSESDHRGWQASEQYVGSTLKWIMFLPDLYDSLIGICQVELMTEFCVWLREEFLGECFSFLRVLWLTYCTSGTQASQLALGNSSVPCSELPCIEKYTYRSHRAKWMNVIDFLDWNNSVLSRFMFQLN